MGDNETTTSIGWIGAGRMGYAMIERLLDAGHDVSVYNRTRSKAEPLAQRGAKLVDSPAQLADRDVVFVMVAASEDLEAVTIGEDGLLTADSSPQIIVDSSTVSATVSEKIRGLAAERGTALLAAPVSGNPKVVRSGKLTLAVSGPKEAFDRAEPLLKPLGRGVTYVGEGEVARLVKICHNVFLGVVVQSLAEITVLAERGGTSRQAFLEFLNNSVMGSTFTRYKSPAFVNLDFTPTFTNILLRKDFDLGLEAAREHGVPMPVAALAAEMVSSAIGAGHTTEDFATLLLEQARRSGVELVSENVDVDDGLGTDTNG
ncbi:6-phosphogluconate dehydrogenase [Mycolicibacterium agri]|uniref:3-hydroxyisobutyrate dehydrogenase n=1 Tax=Mycolicibacterium agri TaxID=36811 RepID=A0A2A7N018_MYCAG|nr:NAD(P)-dependent oxidoreductase [Mycolicibacterium agri]PEG37087.1 6-phosphogluconate dehydrogenase [Mycolicibacterium agri]GFG52071.1 3-hydroxyisobutyrate dehydrogenase [Mycolicibacterium agri]